jgi:hypothetical protein
MLIKDSSSSFPLVAPGEDVNMIGAIFFLLMRSKSHDDEYFPAVHICGSSYLVSILFF